MNTQKKSPHQNFDPSIGTIILTDDNRGPSACRIYSTWFLLRLPFQMLSQVSPSLPSSQSTNKHEILHTTCTRTCPVLCIVYAGIGRLLIHFEGPFWAYLWCWHLFLAFDTLTGLLQVQSTCIQDRYSHILHHCCHCSPRVPEKLHKLPVLTFAVVGDRPFMSQLFLCWVMTLYSFFSSTLHIREISDPYSYFIPTTWHTLQSRIASYKL